MRVDIDTAIGQLASRSEDGRYGLNSVMVGGGYLQATNSHGLAIRRAGPATSAPDGTRLPAKAALPGTVEQLGQDAPWTNDRRNPVEAAPEGDGPWPKFEDMLSACPAGTRWFPVDGELLKKVIEAMASKVDGQRLVALGLDARPNKPMLVLARDRRGMGLVMPFRAAERADLGDRTVHTTRWNHDAKEARKSIAAAAAAKKVKGEA